MGNEKEKLEKLREIIGEILYGINSDFKYCGHGNNLGMWETSDEDELKWTVLEKPDGPDEIDLAMFRVTVYLPNRFGIQIKVEMVSQHQEKDLKKTLKLQIYYILAITI